MAVKNAIYQVDNGSGFDEIHFKTKAKMIFLPDGRTLEEFMNTGGVIANGALSILSGAIRTNKQWFDFHEGATGIYSPMPHRIGLNANGKQVDLMTDDNMPRLEPFHNLQYYLGTKTFRWKEVWAGASSENVNGYTKLPNGFILQWGSFSLRANDGASTIILPIAFPTRTLYVKPSVYGLDGIPSIKTCDIGTGVYFEGASQISIYAKSLVAGINPTLINMGWFAIGC